jgi:hypothetical protein
MSEPKERGHLNHGEIDDIGEAIRAARMIAEVICRTVCEEMQRQPDGSWRFSATGGDLLDYFSGAQCAAMEVVKMKFDAAVGSAGA